MFFRYISLLFIFLSSVFVSFAQEGTGSIRGFVYLEKNGEPAIYTNVFLEGTSKGVVTDANGYFNLTQVPLGKYTLIATSMGFDSSVVEVELKKDGQIVTKKLYVNERSVNLEEVNITAEKQEAQTTVKMSLTKLTPKDIKRMPAIGGDPDLAQYLQVLPGVVFTGDQGGQLFIRGGSPIQNKVLLDGMVIYNPFHSIGLFSVFDTDVLKTADVYTGGFGAEYGGRLSSIIDLKTKDGNNQRLSGKISASTFGAKALLEGPLSKPKSKGGGSKSFLLSFKNSYLDETSPELYSYATDSSGLPYSFSDFYGKVSLNATNGSKVSFFGFSFNDKVDFPEVASFDWNTFGGGANFVLIPANSNTLIDGTVAFSNYEIETGQSEVAADVTDRRSLINGFNAGMNFTNFKGDNESKFGFELKGFKTDFSFRNSVDQVIEQVENTTELAGYWSGRWKFGKLILEPSFRMHFYASLSTLSPEPRLGFKYNVNDNFRIKGAGGLYSQNLLSATSDRDVVNLFFGFLSGPENLQDEFTKEDGSTKSIDDPLQKAKHAILGFEWDVNKYFNVNVEAYLKSFNQLTNVNRNKIFDDNADNADQPDVLKKEFIIETGDAYGIDFAFKYDRKQFSLWAVYSWSRVDRWDGIQEFHPIWDRRHNINLVGSYSFGTDKVWTVDARWNLGSGFPFTQTSGFFEKLTLQGNINQDISNQNGDLGIQFADLNGGRLPWYHRFDLSIKRKMVISEHSVIEATFSVTNVYDRDNIFFVDRITNERIDQLPILPSLGATFTF